ncbi:MAG: RimK family alpha-L-glutamate ligase [Candidatus Aenigmarchaeota archaeon]|nr:RimK family alpha-L-glutamate ligase [Candidatus Aenigmarchaeota archaeon]
MSKLAILGPSKNKIGYSTKRLIEEGKKVFKGCKLVPLIDVQLKIEKGLDVIYDGEKLAKFDYILPRIDSSRAEIGYPIIRFLDDIDIKKPYPAESILIAHNKFLSLEEFAKKGVPVPKTLLISSKNVAKNILKKQKYPIVIKLLSSFGGQGVVVTKNKETAQNIIETMKTMKQEILIEEFIENPGEDIRGIVAGDDIIASFKRVAKPGESRANVKVGGKAVPFKLTEQMEDIVFRCAEALKSKVCAVDLIDGKKGLYVIEANLNPGIEGMEKATNLNVAGRIIEFCKNDMKK